MDELMEIKLIEWTQNSSLHGSADSSTVRFNQYSICTVFFFVSNWYLIEVYKYHPSKQHIYWKTVTVLFRYPLLQFIMKKSTAPKKQQAVRKFTLYALSKSCASMRDCSPVCEPRGKQVLWDWSSRARPRLTRCDSDHMTQKV